MIDEVEIWRALIGYEGLYEVSNLGAVRNIAQRRGTRPGLILKNRITKDGYCKVVLRDSGRDVSLFVHRIVYTCFHGPIPDGMEIDHLDGNKKNNASSNFEAVTRLENIARSFRRGRNMAFGSRQGRSAFTENQVLQIKIRVARGERQNAIAAEFGVTPTAINCIIKGKTWVHVKLPEGFC